MNIVCQVLFLPLVSFLHQLHLFLHLHQRRIAPRPYALLEAVRDISRSEARLLQHVHTLERNLPALAVVR